MIIVLYSVSFYRHKSDPYFIPFIHILNKDVTWYNPIRTLRVLVYISNLNTSVYYVSKLKLRDPNSL